MTMTLPKPHVRAPAETSRDSREPVFELENVNVSYGGNRAVADVSMPIYHRAITAII